jgi:uncharacterized protein YjeT (DUF2065 family)
MMDHLLAGIAIFLIIEGLAYALAPRFLVRVAQLLPHIPQDQLRLLGLTAITFGAAILWLLHG